MHMARPLATTNNGDIDTPLCVDDYCSITSLKGEDDMRTSMFCVAVCVTAFPIFAQGIVIDHNCTAIDNIPQEWITAVQNNIQSHYAHTSHGGQLTYGIGFVEDSDPFYSVEIGSQYLPSTSGAYCVFDGQESVSYITPDLYWESSEGLDLTRDVLDNNPALDTSMWSWCTQCDYYDQSQVQAYLDAMSLLESEYPNVTFVYLTGNAQGTGSAGYNRYLRNNQIRDYCSANDKVLFDFADMDCWWFNTSSSQWEQNTYSYSGTDVPSEHPQYYGDEYGHTTAESCLNKGVAWWWMMAVLAGWGSSGVAEGSQATSVCEIRVSNPVTVPVAVSLNLVEQCPVEMRVFDTSGRCVTRLEEGQLSAGLHELEVPNLGCGIYLIGLNAGDTFISHRIVVVN